MSNAVVALADKPTIVAELAGGQVVYGNYELSRIRKSPDNRKRFNEAALQELAASIKAMGVAQPILIRPVTPTPEAPEDFEIVAGERRYRASIIAGMTTIPAVCRELSDLDAAKIRILENLQREDPHPMEEAEGYQLLMLQHGFTADQLVEEVKKSRAYIYGRLKLCALTPDVREQFLDNKISASTALLIARIPVPKLQVQALSEILKPMYGEPMMSYRAAAAHIQQRYMLDLKSAVFKIEDAKLLKSAGACTTCPKRTGNQPEIFEGISANVCTDPDCYSEKKAAHWAVAVVQANKKGIPVYEGDEANELLSNRWRTDSEFVTSDVSIWKFARNAPHTKNSGCPADYLDDKLMPAVASYAKTESGALMAFYKRVEMQAALEAAGACETEKAHAERMKAAASAPPPQPTAAQAAADAKRKAADQLADNETSFRIALYKRLRERGAAGFSLQSLREFLKFALTEWRLPSDELGDIYDFDTSSDKAIADHIDQAGLPEIQLLLIDMVLGPTFDVAAWGVRGDGSIDAGDFATVLAMAKAEGIDPAHLREEMFPPPIEVDTMEYDDLVKFISRNPARIGDLTKIIMTHPRGELTGMLDKAANSCGYVWTDGTWQHAPLAAEAVRNTKAATEAGQESIQGDASAGEAAAVDDGLDLAAQLDEAESTPAAKPAGKKAKVAQKKPAAKPAAAVPAEKSDKKKATPAAGAKRLTSAAAWPFPKTSTGKRPAAAPTADAAQPTTEETA